MTLDDLINGLPDMSGQSAPTGLDAVIANLPDRSEQYGAMQSAMIGAGKSFKRLGQGAQQVYYAATGNEPAQQKLAADVAEENRLYAPLAQQSPVATAVGEGLPALAGGPMTMAAMGATEYGTPEERALRGALGYAGGKLGQYGGDLIGRAVTPVRTAASNMTQALFDKYGITGLPGQMTGSVPMRWAESVLANLPGGGRIRDIVRGQQTGLNQAVQGAVGGAGETWTPEAAAAAVNAAGSRIGGLTSAVPQVTIDNELKGSLADVASRYGNKLNTLQKPMVEKLIADINAQGESMTGAFYQNTRSDISSMAQDAGGTYKNALTGIYKALDRAFDRSVPEDVAAAVKTARGEYRTGKVTQPMATVTGDVSPARVAGAAKALPPQSAYLAQLGQAMKGLPDSGSAQRLLYQSLLSGGVGAGAGLATGDPTEAMKFAGGSLAAPWLASQLLTRAPLRNYLTNQVITPEIEKMLERAGMIPGSGLAGLLMSR